MPRFPTARRAPNTGKQILMITLVISSVIFVVSFTACAGMGWYVFSLVSNSIGNYSQMSVAKISASEFMRLLMKDQPDQAYDSASAEFRSKISREEWAKLSAQFPSLQEMKPISHNSVEGEAPHRTFTITYQSVKPYQPILIAEPELELEPAEKKYPSLTIHLIEESEGVWKVQRFIIHRDP
jgi:hypothetical protein